MSLTLMIVLERPVLMMIPGTLYRMNMAIDDTLNDDSLCNIASINNISTHQYSLHYLFFSYGLWPSPSEAGIVERSLCAPSLPTYVLSEGTAFGYSSNN